MSKLTLSIFWERLSSSNNTLGLFITALIWIGLFLLCQNLGDIALKLLSFPTFFPLWIAKAWLFCTSVSFVHYLTIILDDWLKRRTVVSCCNGSSEENIQKAERLNEKRWWEHKATFLGWIIFGLLGVAGAYKISSEIFAFIRLSAAGGGIASRLGRSIDLLKWIGWLRNYELSILASSLVGIALTAFVALFITPLHFVDGMIFVFGFVAGASDVGRVFDSWWGGKTIFNFFCFSREFNKKAKASYNDEGFRIGPYERLITNVGFFVCTVLGIYLFFHGYIPNNMLFLLDLPSWLGGTVYTLIVVGVFNGPFKRIGGRIADAVFDKSQTEVPHMPEPPPVDEIRSPLPRENVVILVAAGIDSLPIQTSSALLSPGI